MKYLVSIFTFLISVCHLNAQAFNERESIRKGLYDSFYEFRINKPSISGEVNYLKTNSGSRVRKLIINEDSIYFNYTKAYGYFKDNNFYINTPPIISRLEPARVATSKFNPLEEIGYYSFVEVPTELSSTGVAVAGGVAGGVVGALVVITVNEIAKKQGREKNNRLIAIHHQTGEESMVDTYFIKTIQDSLQSYGIAPSRNAETMLIDEKKEIIRQFNGLKSKDMTFDPEMFYGELIFTRRAKRQSDINLEIYVNDVNIGVLDKQISYRVNHLEPVTVVFKSTALKESEQLVIDIDSKEHRYYRVSYKAKSPEKIDIDKIDFTRTKYVLEEYD